MTDKFISWFANEFPYWDINIAMNTNIKYWVIERWYNKGRRK